MTALDPRALNCFGHWALCRPPASRRRQALLMRPARRQWAVAAARGAPGQTLPAAAPAPRSGPRNCPACRARTLSPQPTTLCDGCSGCCPSYILINHMLQPWRGWVKWGLGGRDHLAHAVPGGGVKHHVGSALEAVRLHDGLRVGDPRQPELELLQRTSAGVQLLLAACAEFKGNSFDRCSPL